MSLPIPGNCLYCAHVPSTGAGSLRAHLRKAHGVTAQTYYDQFFGADDGPKGLCIVCQRPSGWRDTFFRYKPFCSPTCGATKNWQDDQQRRVRMSERMTTQNCERWNADTVYRQTMSEHVKARIADTTNDFGPGKIPSSEGRLRLSAAMKQRMQDPLVREKMSILATARVLNKQNRFGTGWGKVGYYAGVWMRSSWERRLASDLDKLGIPWEYEAHTFQVRGRRYTPDFFLPNQKLYLEVRPASKIDTLLQTKVAGVQSQGHVISIITELSWQQILSNLGGV